MSQRSFSITPVPPFRLDLTAWALRRRPENAVDRWDGTTYRRVLMIDRQAVEVAVHQSGGPEKPQLAVDLTGPRLTVQQEDFARVLLERMLGVHRDLKTFLQAGNARSKIAAVSRRIPRAQATAISHGVRSSGQWYCMPTTLACWWEFFCLAAWRMKSVSCRQTRRMRRTPSPIRQIFRGEGAVFEISGVQRQQIAGFARRQFRDS